MVLCTDTIIGMQLSSVRLEIPEGGNLILGASHFIKTVEDSMKRLSTRLRR